MSTQGQRRGMATKQVSQAQREVPLEIAEVLLTEGVLTGVEETEIREKNRREELDHVKDLMMQNQQSA